MILIVVLELQIQQQTVTKMALRFLEIYLCGIPYILYRWWFHHVVATWFLLRQYHTDLSRLLIQSSSPFYLFLNPLNFCCCLPVLLLKKICTDWAQHILNVSRMIWLKLESNSTTAKKACRPLPLRTIEEWTYCFESNSIVALLVSWYWLIDIG
jgi:hypothetical protein